MARSTVDEIVAKFNADWIWSDPCRISEVAASVAGSRKNGPELIEFIEKMSESRGYSALLLKVAAIERLMKDPLIEDGLTDVIVRVCDAEKGGAASVREKAIAKVVDFIASNFFPVRAELSELVGLMEAVARRFDNKRVKAVEGGLLTDVLEAEEDDCGQLRKAVEEAAGFEFCAEAGVSAAGAIVAAHSGEHPEAKESVASALEGLFEPLHFRLEKLKREIDLARGFAELDEACARAPWASALDLFSRRWRVYRGTAKPRQINAFGAAIVGRDLQALKELIGGRDPAKIEIPQWKLPHDVLRWPWKWASLISVAAAVGGEPLRYLIGFHGLKPDLMALSQAVAFGDPETIRMVWDRMDEDERVSNPEPMRIAIDFHHVEVSRWLLQEQPSWLIIGRVFAREARAFDVLSRLPGGREGLPELGNPLRVERNTKFDVAVADAVAARGSSWLAAALLAGGNPNADITDPFDRGERALCHAAKSGREDDVRLLLQFGAEPNKEGRSWITPLALGAEYPRIVALLLETGANPNAGGGRSHSSPLANAARAKDVESLRLMLAHG
jgi:hypothetical protein